MVAKQSVSLELLPAELQRDILDRMPNLQSLLGLIRASKRYYAVYLHSKSAILSNVILNTFPPSIFPLAVWSFQLRKFRNPPRRPRKEVFDFLEKFKSKTFEGSYKFPVNESMEILRFHEIVEYFIRDFAANRSLVFESYLRRTNPKRFELVQHAFGKYHRESSGSRTLIVELSEVERGRLMRGFYYMELYGHLFHTPEDDLDDITPAEQSTFFLQHLVDWELEEFLCIQGYLKENVSKFLIRLEDDFMERYLKGEPYIEPESGTFSNNRWGNEDWFFSDNGIYDQDHWSEGCLARGLSVLKTMFTATTNRERRVAFGNDSSPRNVMSEALEENPIHRDRPIIAYMKGGYVDIFFQDTLENHGEGWLWGVNTAGHPRYGRGPFEGLRRIGYAIWDHRRLKGLELLKKSPYIVGMGCQSLFPGKQSLERRTRNVEKIWGQSGVELRQSSEKVLTIWELST